jgi:hypothetical protein
MVAPLCDRPPLVTRLTRKKERPAMFQFRRPRLGSLLQQGCFQRSRISLDATVESAFRR